MEISLFKENIKLTEVGKILKSVVPKSQYISRKLVCYEQGRGFCLSSLKKEERDMERREGQGWEEPGRVRRLGWVRVGHWGYRGRNPEQHVLTVVLMEVICIFTLWTSYPSLCLKFPWNSMNFRMLHASSGKGFCESQREKRVHIEIKNLQKSEGEALDFHRPWFWGSP